MTTENRPSKRQRWIVAAVLVLAIDALLAARAYMRQQRAEELARAIEDNGGRVRCPTSIRDAVQILWETGQWRRDAATVVVLGSEFDSEWIRRHAYLADLEITDLHIVANRIETATIARLIQIHPIAALASNHRTASDELAAALAAETELKRVSFLTSDLTDAGLRRLPLEQLLLVGVDQTQVTAAGLSQLTRCHGLQSVSLNGNQLTEDSRRNSCRYAATRGPLPVWSRGH